jgi:hypothetical protein
MIHLAATHGLAERLVHVYHTMGLNIADPNVLTRLGAEVGLETGLEGAADVWADERRAELGIMGVPALVIDGGPAGAGCTAGRRPSPPGRAGRQADSTRALVGTPLPAVTSTFSTSGSWFAAVPRIWRTPSAIPFMPWM